MRGKVDWTRVWRLFDRWFDREVPAWPKQQRKIESLVRAQLKPRSAKKRGGSRPCG